MIEVKNLVKKYGDHIAVDNISFTVQKGKIYGFLGPNGAGKSTTMNIITGCLAATSGEVTINGYDIFKDALKAKASVGYLPEQPPLYTDMTPSEYLLFVGQLKGIRKNNLKKAVETVIEKTGLSDVRDRLIKNLSKGYKQRVGLAQAILGDPEVIILDEPTVGLDPAQIVEIRNVIKSLAENHTVIFSSHILSEVNEICDHILIISHGKIVAENTPENLEEAFVSGYSISLTVKGDPERIESVVGAVEGIDSFDITPDEDGKTDIVIECAKDSDVSQRLSKALFENDYYILRLEEKKATLEDVFMELVTTDAVIEEVPEEALEVDADAVNNGEVKSVWDEHMTEDDAQPEESEEKEEE
ncbi:MAG: ABC transporter ATP-binding protein [Clostridia bacterium]|nr:ABC transporter ATP-binding protein [Clostridia bacterium]